MSINTSQFYGRKTAVQHTRLIPDDSDDSQLSESGDSDVEDVESTHCSNSGSSSGDDDSSTTEEQQPSTSHGSKKAPPKPRAAVWKKVRDDVRTQREVPEWSNSLSEVDSVHEPIEYFRKFFDNDVLENIVEQSNIYAVQKDVTKPLNLQIPELEQFISSVIYMSVFKLPRSRMYWQQKIHMSDITDLFSRNRWQQIKSHLHFNNNIAMPDAADQNRDRLFKIRPLVDALTTKFREIPAEQSLSVDEQMIPFKGHSSLRQYIPSKPYKYGYKVFMLCSASGLLHNFEIFTGKLPAAPGNIDIGGSGNIVLKLCDIIEPHKNHLVYFNNWFSTWRLFVELGKKGILSMGTMRANRLAGCKLSTDNELKKQGRGSFDENEAEIDNVQLRVVKWFDNKCVTIGGSFASAHPISVTRRWNKATKSYIDVSRPDMVKLYNKSMGGVDALDAMISFYRLDIRSKRFYLRFFFHFIDLVITNGWLLYRRDCNSLEIPVKRQKNLLTFRLDVADALAKVGKDAARQVRKRGRPSAGGIQQKLDAKRRRPATKPLPTNVVRTDSVGHWPTMLSRQRCKRPGCKRQTVFSCTKCNVHLCIARGVNCFTDFHM